MELHRGLPILIVVKISWWKPEETTGLKGKTPRQLRIRRSSLLRIKLLILVKSP
jgi:hypothetical protein